MELVEDRALIDVCLNCPYEACHAGKCSRYSKARRALMPERKTKLYYARGQWKSLRDWARVCGIASKTLRYRIVDCSWSVERALTEPTRAVRLYAARGTEMSVPEWALRLDVTDSMIYARLREGWSMERIVDHYERRRRTK